jgi:hypothetical protein
MRCGTRCGHQGSCACVGATRPTPTALATAASAPTSSRPRRTKAEREAACAAPWCSKAVAAPPTHDVGAAVVGTQTTPRRGGVVDGTTAGRNDGIYCEVATNMDSHNIDFG